MWKRTLPLLLAASSVAVAPSCSCSDAETTSGTGGSGAGNGTNTGTTNPSATGGANGAGGSGGQVLVGGVGSSGATGTGGGTGEGGSCADITISFEPIIPTVMLLIDQSGSMDNGFGGGQSRWEALYDTLMDPVDGVVTSLQTNVRFGLATYTGRNNGVCPTIQDVPIALGNRDAIDAVYAPLDPQGDTPTGDAIDAVLPQVVAFPEPGPKFIVLCTDGEPDTCEDGNGDGRPEALAAAQNAFASDVGTYIISVGDDVGEDHLQDMANAGVGLPIGGGQDAPFWQALDAQGLADAFATIIDGVRSCVLTVDGEINPDKACDGEVRIDDVAIPCDDPNGWVLNSPTEIELQGDACDLIQSGEHVVDATFPCDAAETSSSGGPN